MHKNVNIEDLSPVVDGFDCHDEWQVFAQLDPINDKMFHVYKKDSDQTTTGRHDGTPLCKIKIYLDDSRSDITKAWISFVIKQPYFKPNGYTQITYRLDDGKSLSTTSVVFPRKFFEQSGDSRNAAFVHSGNNPELMKKTID